MSKVKDEMSEVAGVICYEQAAETGRACFPDEARRSKKKNLLFVKASA